LAPWAKLGSERLASLQKHFGPKRHVFIPTVDVVSLEQTLETVQRLQALNVDGVFLMNTRMRPSELFELANVVAERCQLWVGVHVVRAFLETVFQKIPSNISGLWVEDAGINEWIPQAGHFAARMKEARDKSPFKGLYFGGITLNHATLSIPRERLDRLATMAMPWLDVVCVRSHSIDAEKIRAGLSAEFPMAIVGALNAREVYALKDLTQCYVVQGLDERNIVACQKLISTF
jgi:hypothetical protein